MVLEEVLQGLWENKKTRNGKSCFLQVTTLIILGKGKKGRQRLYERFVQWKLGFYILYIAAVFAF